MFGETISHYRILEKLGQGGMGEVWLAEDVRLGHRVAIKRLPAAMAGERDARIRFQREAQAVAQLRHPNIVTLFEFDEIEGEYILITEYVGGGSLRDRLADGPLPLDWVLRWGVQAAEGLAEAHRRGVLHRDIKPDNLLLTEEGDLRISDFGLARLENATQMTQAGTAMGTLAYTAPEQARGEAVDERADLFALGVTLYELLAGRSPFAGGTRAATLRAVLEESPPLLSGFRQDIPVDVQELLDRLLQKDAALRPRSAREVVDALRAAADSASFPNATPLSTVKPTPVHHTINATHARTATLVGALLIAMIVTFWSLGSDAPAISSLAVLPLTSVSERADQDYLAAGMTEALIQEFGKIPSLKVISHQSVRQYRDSQQSLREIARDLGVASILEGSVMQFGDELRITVRVTDIGAGDLILNEEFDGSAKEVLRLYSQVTSAVVDQIQLSLTPEEERRLTGQREVNPEAYALYLRGRHHWDHWTAEELEVSMDYLERATAIDSTFAAPYASLASIYSEMNLKGMMGVDAASARAKRAAERALELDPNLAEAHSSMGRITFFFDWDFDRAEKHFRRAIELNPNSSECRYQYATFLVFAGRGDESVSEMKKAVQLDPMSHRRNTNLGWSLVHARRFDEAIEHLRNSLELYEVAPDSTHEWWVHYLLSASYRLSGRFDEALEEMDAWNVNRGDRASLYLMMDRASDAIALFEDAGDAVPGWLWAGAGRRAEALTSIDRLQTLYSDGQPHVAVDIAIIYSILDEKDLAFEWLERAYDARLQRLLYLPWVNWQWDNLRDDPRFEDLLSRIRSGK